jgi:hypothetical protein
MLIIVSSGFAPFALLSITPPRLPLSAAGGGRLTFESYKYPYIKNRTPLSNYYVDHCFFMIRSVRFALYHAASPAFIRRRRRQAHVRIL